MHVNTHTSVAALVFRPEAKSKEPVSKRIIDGDNPESELKNAAKSPSDDDAGPEPEQLPVMRETRKLNWINFANRFPDQKDTALIELLIQTIRPEHCA
ncbi:hypothetical protein BDW75DRAFT_244358 [Aspergillus navahoensis]